VQGEWTTLDGLPISRSKPYGAMVVVHRPWPAGREFLALHRAARGPDHQGDWAWTPPSGARLPDEPVEQCARRELVEETGLELLLQRLPTTAEDWAVFVAEAPVDAQIVLDGEHDRFAWLTVDELLARCTPAHVTEQIRHAIEHIVSTLRSSTTRRDGILGGETPQR